MEAAWEDDSPQARFMCRLHNQVVDQLVSDPKQFLLRHMRHDFKMVREYQKRFGYIFQERGLNLYELIARACGEVWDNEDEEKGGVQSAAEKSAPMEVKKRSPHAVRVDCPRQVGVREGKRERHVVQAGSPRRAPTRRGARPPPPRNRTRRQPPKSAGAVKKKSKCKCE